MDGNLQISPGLLVTIVGGVFAVLTATISSVFWLMIKAKDKSYEDIVVAKDKGYEEMKKEKDERLTANEVYYRTLREEMNVKHLNVYNDRESLRQLLRQAVRIIDNLAENLDMTPPQKKMVKDFKDKETEREAEGKPSSS